MSWSDDMTDLAAALVDPSAFGLPALYTPEGSLAAPIHVQAIDTPSAQAVGESGFVEIRHEIHLSRTAQINPARGDTLTFTASGETFAVQQHEPDGPFWRLIVRKAGN